MQSDVVKTAQNILNTALEVVREIPLTNEPYMVWRKSGSGSWTSEYEERPSLLTVFLGSLVDWDDLAAPLSKTLQHHYPDYLGLVGTSMWRVRLSAAMWL